MLISGAWYVCDDGIARPIIRGEIRAADRSWVAARFLVDTGAPSGPRCRRTLPRLRLQRGPEGLRLNRAQRYAPGIEI
jgi:hypothetical protein